MSRSRTAASSPPSPPPTRGVRRWRRGAMTCSAHCWTPGSKMARAARLDVWIGDGRVVATIPPPYSGCPAMATMRDDLQRELLHAGFEDAEVRVSLSPAWTSDWITEAGRKALQDAGISPPGQAPR